MKRTSDLHIAGISPLVSPSRLKEQYPLSETAASTVIESRRTVIDIIRRRDPRMLGIVGPCSIHDEQLALDYARRLRELARTVEDTIYLVMRVYFEKPRTRLGWRGLILDPDLDGSYDIAEGLRRARRILRSITDLGLPAGSEMLDPIVPQYTSDLVTWASIGARTTESQTHREMASGLSMPVGFKNGTDGSVATAINALTSSLHEHRFIGIDQDGNTSILHTTGNPNGHVILRGGRSGPNYHEEDVEDAVRQLREAGLGTSLLVDCSHANSQKDFTRQNKVFRSLIQQRREGQDAIVGFMLESNIHEGRQDIPDDPAKLTYGISVTDPCIGWEETERLLLGAHAELSRTVTSTTNVSR